MFQVRYYSEVFHPSRFKAGLLGLAIRVLNWLRWRLEVMVQRLVLKYFTRENYRPELRKEVETRLLKKFRIDDNFERFKAQLEPNHNLLFSEDGQPPTLDDEVTQQPLGYKDIGAMISRYGNKTRAKRYATRGYGRKILIEDFEEV